MSTSEAWEGQERAVNTDSGGYFAVILVVIIGGGVGVLWVVGWCFDQAVRADRLITKGMFVMVTVALLYFSWLAVTALVTA